MNATKYTFSDEYKDNTMYYTFKVMNTNLDLSVDIVHKSYTLQ